MRKVVDYIVVTGVAYNLFEPKVLEKIGEDYQPYGNLLVSEAGEFFQAMVKYEEESCQNKENK